MAIDREPPIGARRRRVVRRLVPIGLGAALIFARRVAAARADGEIPPTAIRADGICQGFAYRPGTPMPAGRSSCSFSGLAARTCSPL